MQNTSLSIVVVLLISTFMLFAPTISHSDHAGPAEVAARDLVAAAEREDWAGVKLYAKRIHDPLLTEYAIWLRIQHDKKKASFGEIVGFIDRHPTWPRQSELRRLAESAIDSEVPQHSLLDWFARHPPVSGKGAMAHLRAIAESGDTSPIPEYARSYWRHRNFDAADERQFLRMYGTHLDRDTHLARLDRLIWQRGHTAATRMLKFVPGDYASLARARIALLRRSAGVDGAISRVPAHLKDAPELWFERL